MKKKGVIRLKPQSKEWGFDDTLVVLGRAIKHVAKVSGAQSSKRRVFQKLVVFYSSLDWLDMLLLEYEHEVGYRQSAEQYKSFVPTVRGAIENMAVRHAIQYREVI